MLLHWPEGAKRPVVKLCDFGYSRFQAEACCTGCGTPEYMAPEVIIIPCSCNHCVRSPSTLCHA